MSFTVQNFVEQFELLMKEGDAVKIADRFLEFKEQLKDCLLIEWDIYDLLCRAEDLNMDTPDRKELREMLQILDRRHECCYGITWDDIDHVLSDHVLQNKK